MKINVQHNTSLRMHRNLNIFCMLIFTTLSTHAIQTPHPAPAARPAGVNATLQAMAKSAKSAAANAQSAITYLGTEMSHLPGRAIGLVASGGQSAQPVKFITGPTNSLASVTGYKPDAHITRAGWNFKTAAKTAYNLPGRAIGLVGSGGKSAQPVQFITGPTNSLASLTGYRTKNNPQGSWRISNPFKQATGPVLMDKTQQYSHPDLMNMTDTPAPVTPQRLTKEAPARLQQQYKNDPNHLAWSRIKNHNDIEPQDLIAQELSAKKRPRPILGAKKYSKSDFDKIDDLYDSDEIETFEELKARTNAELKQPLPQYKNPNNPYLTNKSVKVDSKNSRLDDDYDEPSEPTEPADNLPVIARTAPGMAGHIPAIMRAE